MIRRKAARFVFNDFARLFSVATMLGWDSLGKQRDQLTMMMLFKIINNLVVIPHSHIPLPLPEVPQVNSSTCMKESIHINFPFSHEQSDFGTLYPIM